MEVPESAVDVVDPEFVPLFPLPLAWHETREIKPMVVRTRPKTPKTVKNRFRQLEAIFSLRVLGGYLTERIGQFE